MTTRELPSFYIIGHSALVKAPSEPLPENTCLITYALCGESVLKRGPVRRIEEAFFEKSRRFPHNVMREWRQFNEQIGDSHLRIKTSPAKYHNQSIKLSAYWYVDKNNKPTENLEKATSLKLARSGIYALIRTHGISRYVDIDIPIQTGMDAIVSRLQIGDIYAGAIFPNVEDIDLLFGENAEMLFQDFFSALRKLTTRRKLHTLKGILTMLGEGAYFLTSACRVFPGATKEEIDAMRISSEEADTITQQAMSQVSDEKKNEINEKVVNEKVGVGTKRRRNKRKKRRGTYKRM